MECLESNERTLLNSPTGKAWKKIGIHPHHGILTPLSSLHSENSCGIGEFFDLIPIINWCKQLKMDILQLLPLNNSEADPSPYNSCSSCALNLIYLSLHALPHLDKNKLPQLCSLKNLTNRVNYQEVFHRKMHWLRTYFELFGKTIAKSPSFQQYLNENPWLERTHCIKHYLTTSTKPP